MNRWKIRDTGCSSAESNMQIDRQWLEEVASLNRGVLHLYEWQGDCATYGHFIKPADHLNMEGVAKHKLSLARRPTGGGIIFHIWDLAFSALMPASHAEFSLNTLENYATINRKVIRAVAQCTGERMQLLPTDPSPVDRASSHFCMAKPTIYDVVTEDGRKIGGAAQRRTRKGLLHQGTISLAAPPKEYLEELLLPGTQVIQAMRAHTHTLLPSDWTPQQLQETRCQLKEALKEAFLQ